MKWRHIHYYAAIHPLIIAGKARPTPSIVSTSFSQSSTRGMHRETDDDSALHAASHLRGQSPEFGHRSTAGEVIDEEPRAHQRRTPSVGGGAINEKPRSYRRGQKGDSAADGGGKDILGWDPGGNLSHMLHALVGLDRYPDYLGRFRNAVDIDLLEGALQARIADVRRQKSEIMERRDGIRRLVKRYVSSLDEVEARAESDVPEEDGSELWRGHLTLSPPRTWLELRRKNILQDQAFKVAYRSISKASNKKPGSKGHSTQKQRFGGINRVGVFPTVEDILLGKARADLDPPLLEDWMSQEMFDVYSFPLLTNDFCFLLRKTLRELSALAESNEFSHLQLGRRNIDLDSIGLGWINDLLFNMFIQPATRHLFAITEQIVDQDSADNGSRVLDWRQGYVAGYSAYPSGSKGATRHRLVPHTDDSEVTLNCCLGEEAFEGGDVEFFGLRGTPEEWQFIGRVRRPNVGTALLHSGRHLHAVSDVVSGDRYALIIWSRSWGRLRSNTCPCCWLNRRQDSSCICDSRWN